MNDITTALSAASAAGSALALIEQSLITLAVGEIIEQASGPAAQLAKAETILEVVQGLEKINSGNAAGVSGLQTAFLALVKTVSDPAIQLAFNGLLAAVLTKIEGYQASGSLLGKVGGIVANDFLGYVAATCQAYITNLTPTAA